MFAGCHRIIADPITVGKKLSNSLTDIHVAISYAKFIYEVIGIKYIHQRVPIIVVELACVFLEI